MFVKKFMAKACVLFVTVSLLSGCTKTNQQGGNIPTGNNANGTLIAAEPLTLTIHMHYENRFAFNDEWNVFKKAAEITNINLHGVAPQSATDSRQVFGIMMASNSFADIIHGEKNDINGYAVEGAFQPLDELIDQYAPNIKKFLDSNPWYKKGAVASDGKLYFLPYAHEGTVSEGFFVRQDWLDNLGLQAPKTVEEFYNMLISFRDKDPNKNGKKDEVPYIYRQPYLFNLEYLFGARSSWYEKDGKVCYGPYMPEFKNAMVNLAKWYQEGLIDKEVFTRGAKARDILFGNNTGGATCDWFASTSMYNDNLKDKIPGFKLVPMDPPADVNGKVWIESKREKLSTPLWGWGISLNNKHAVETIKYFDFWFSEKGRILNNFGVEGKHYEMVDGKPQFTESILHGNAPVNELMWKDGGQMKIGTQLMFENEKQWMNSIAREGVQRYMDQKFVPESGFPVLAFNAEEEKALAKKWNAIDTFVKESRARWIMGAEPVNDSNFDKYLSDLKKIGMDEVLKIYNDAYKRYNSQ